MDFGQVMISQRHDEKSDCLIVGFFRRMLEMSLNSTSGIRKQDATSVISQVSYNSLGRYMTFNFVREKWATLKQT